MALPADNWMGKSWTKPEVLTNLHDVGHPEVAVDGRVQEVVRRMSFKSPELLADLQETEQKMLETISS